MLTLRSGPDRVVARPEVSCGQDGKRITPRRCVPQLPARALVLLWWQSEQLTPRSRSVAPAHPDDMIAGNPRISPAYQTGMEIKAIP
jgi:hypothetical protein